ncbi:MAG: type II toxin-antitoxin system RelE/ParE family toxin [Bacteroidales bacterium]|nr:type II toxin-antitoxin system RelE/ParE family toxin [Bacteroidales bacterium]
MEISVEYLEEAQAYIADMPEKARKKLFHNVALVCVGVKDDRIFKKLSESGIWEFKAEYESNEYRLLSFWDKEKSSYIVATHGFDKKTQKTPRKEIAHAEKIRDEYYKSK